MNEYGRVFSYILYFCILKNAFQCRFTSKNKHPENEATFISRSFHEEQEITRIHNNYSAEIHCVIQN